MADTNRFRFSSSPVMGGLTPGVKWLLTANTLVFILCYLSRGIDAAVVALFGLEPAAVVHRLAVWQLAGYLFIHDSRGFTHILMNMLTLWMFGVPVENAWGTRRFLRYYFLCGIGAGIAVVVLNYLIGNPDAVTIGASGAIYGLLVAFGMLFPEARVLFFFLFPIPARVYVWIMVAIVFLSSMGASGGNVSHVAHLGGIAVGFLLLKTGWGLRAAGRARSYRSHESLWSRARQSYRDWKMARARRKFEIYLRQHGSAPREPRGRQ